MKTHSRPSRGSTEIAVRTAPSRSPSSARRRCCVASAAVNWAPPATRHRRPRVSGIIERLPGRIGQIGPRRLGRVGRIDEGILRRRHMRQRAQRQAVADRAVARHQKHMAAPCLPFLRTPAMPGGLRLPALDRQHETRRASQAHAKTRWRCGARSSASSSLELSGVTLSGRLPSLRIHSAGSS
jgi:hypothetical protein